ncbi:ATPase [Fenollaria massiliensis]|uniref:ATPase n=1 Tax=Fenollaria massiliensis TaxID=938288 RepID=A0A9E7IX99_9FIRM|nr:ATPase [Fenollaria massiliensis]UQK59650.1 ATPase [Fenollaria massiliensis]
MDVLGLIDEIEDIVESAGSLPLTSKVLVQKEELLDIISELRIKLPDEIKQAAWIKEERERIISEANKDAEQIIKETRLKLEELVSKEEVLKEANERAKDLMNKAQIASTNLKRSSLEYSDKLLMNAQENLKDMITTLNENRTELRKMSASVNQENQLAKEKEEK